MNKIGIIGAGLSGLTLAKKLSLAGNDVVLFDRSPLGIASYEVFDGVPVHHVGGHCLSQKRDNVISFINEHILSDDNWQTVERKALVELFPNVDVTYPIELGIGQKGWPKVVVEKITQELKHISASRPKKPKTLHEYLINSFGRTLTQIYFEPYNKKIWCEDPRNLDFEWVKDKTPQVSADQILDTIKNNNIMKIKDTDHAIFKYPIIDKSGKNNFLFNFSKIHPVIPRNIIKIDCHRNSYTLTTDKKEEYIVHTLIYTGSLNSLPKIMGIKVQHLSYLEINPVTSSVVRGPPGNFSWKYIPNKDYCFHRIINMSYFARKHEESQHIYAVETTGVIDPSLVIKSIKKYNSRMEVLKILAPKPGYVTFKPHQQDIVKNIRDLAAEKKIHLCGRFATWSYDNADICIDKALRLAEDLS